jgi:hypothetical protein
MNELLEKIDHLQKQIDEHRPLSRESLFSLREYYKIGLTWSSNAMEGNTLTESETRVVIEDGLTIGGKPLRDHLEAQGKAKIPDPEQPGKLTVSFFLFFTATITYLSWTGIISGSLRGAPLPIIYGYSPAHPVLIRKHIMLF